MGDRWVINASPVILLAKAEVIEFLPSLCDDLVIPAGVVGEVQNLHITDELIDRAIALAGERKG